MSDSSGTPFEAAGVRTSGDVVCPQCGGQVRAGFPFCPACGRRVAAAPSGPACPRCGTPVPTRSQYCAACGFELSRGIPPGQSLSAPAVGQAAAGRFRLALIDEAGTVLDSWDLPPGEITLGRDGSTIEFHDDLFLSPLHAKLTDRNGRLSIRDLGSRNGTWVFLTAGHRLVDGDLLLVGSQLLEFKRLGYPGPHPPERDATRRMGSLVPSADIARLTQLRSDGSERDAIHLSPGRDVIVGRERGDWIFPYDPSMSGQHAEIRSEDADFVALDLDSRNGVAVAARGEVELGAGSRILVGDKLLRVEVA